MLLKLESLTKNYKRAERSFAAVDDVNFTINQGDFVGIIGRSGSGKTTLLNMISGLVKPTAGKVMLLGEDLYSKSDDEISKIRNTTIGYIPQQSALLGNLQVIENVCLPYFLYPREGDPFGKAHIFLEQLGIAHLAKSYPKELSGGERKRVLIARAMLNEPKIIIADEPTSDLDIESTKEVMRIFQKLNENGTTLMLVTHELDTIDYTKALYTMREGKLIAGKALNE